jgi:hypothetical protein
MIWIYSGAGAVGCCTEIYLLCVGTDDVVLPLPLSFPCRWRLKNTLWFLMNARRRNYVDPADVLRMVRASKAIMAVVHEMERAREAEPTAEQQCTLVECAKTLGDASGVEAGYGVEDWDCVPLRLLAALMLYVFCDPSAEHTGCGAWYGTTFASATLGYRR